MMVDLTDTFTHVLPCEEPQTGGATRNQTVTTTKHYSVTAPQYTQVTADHQELLRLLQPRQLQLQPDLLTE